MLTSLALHSLLFPCKEGALRVNIKVSMHVIFLGSMITLFVMSTHEHIVSSL